MTKYDIVGLGVSTLDFLTVVEEFPSTEGVRKATRSLLQGGGPIATAMVTAARLGAKVAMIDSLGDDRISDLILDEFKEAGVETRYIRITNGATASIASINVRERDGQRAIVYSPGSAPDLTDIPRDIIQQATIVHMNGRHSVACKNVCKIRKSVEVLLSFDGGAGRFREEIRELAECSDICIVSETFANEWIGKCDLEDMLERITEKGPRLAIITMGERGSIMRTQDGRLFHQTAYCVPVVDTTGCGDVYHGVFLSAYARGYELEKAIKWASAAAAMKATRLGARSYIPTPEQIGGFLISRH